jgi:hypothetical protein
MYKIFGHKTLDQQMHSYYTLLYLQYNRCESVRHVSIPCWDHHQGHSLKIMNYTLPINNIGTYKNTKSLKVKAVGSLSVGPSIQCIGSCLFTCGTLGQTLGDWH